MCTVTLVRNEGKIIITSNRDERTSRPASHKPEMQLVGNKKLLFPKDPLAGGSWFVVDDGSNVGVLLNGADKPHAIKSSYRISRGIILLNLLAAPSPINEWHKIDLTGIEPFTVVLTQGQQSFQLRWNEISKDQVSLDETTNYIWSSATLYTEEIRQARAKWFNTFLNEFPDATPQQLREFHKYTKGNDPKNGLVINRDNVVLTQSITQAVIENNKVELHHDDLLTSNAYTNSLLIV